MRYSPLLALALAVGGTGLVASSDTTAQNAREVRQTAQASMTLSGKIDIGTEGQVTAFELAHADKVPADLAAFVTRQVQAWRFAPMMVDGAAVAIQTPVIVRLVQQPDSNGDGANVRVTGASFAKYDPESTSRVTFIARPAPIYPKDVYAVRGRGDVLMLLKIARDGSVADVFTEQVNLRVVGKERQMSAMRASLARASEAAARTWTFRPPTTGAAKDAESWNVRVPVRYAMGEPRMERYGEWEAYIPGPHERAPFSNARADANAAPDLLADGGLYMADLDDGPRLLTPLGG
ncbi:energy transducer TonB [Stenotrophomonas sp.]|jgi:hypothetical protein|uniref:energy transducer TonB n=1 Tax=Stenotrophomonas sp. TaxID=69392 RepID=UPI0028A2A30F|nr:energy transducer TonB [Stenotrophomonas sp.]